MHNGAMEVLQLLPHEIVPVEDLPKMVVSQENESSLIDKEHYYKIHVVPVAMEDAYYRTDGGEFDQTHFEQHAKHYRSLFAQRVAPFANVILNCSYWDARFPRLLTKQELRRLYEQNLRRLLLVSDISCDVHGSMEFLGRTTTVETPFYQYDPIRECEVARGVGADGLTVMGVDILPAELPRESSVHFGETLIDVVTEMVNIRNEQEWSVRGIDQKLLSGRLVCSRV